MITVSDAWNDIQRRFLLPESFVEIDIGFTDEEAQRVATASGTDEAIFSNAASVVGTSSSMTKYATNELNLWALDGTRTILHSSGAYSNAGYVSDIASTGSITVNFPVIQSTAISGVTITWSNKFGEYAKVFSVIGKYGESIVSEVTITDNKNQVSTVFIPLENYNSVTVIVHEWSVPYRRARIEKIVMGHLVTFTKKDLLSFVHEQDGDLLSGKVPKYSIEFSLDNSDGRWDPNNPTSMAQYLFERQKLTVRYGMDINGSTEWIKAGVFYLSEWNAPPNGLEARFVARDTFEFLLNSDVNGFYMGGNLSAIITGASSSLLPKDSKIESDPVLANTSFREVNVTESTTAAEIVQKCAHAGCCVMRYDRDGIFHVEPFKQAFADYIIMDEERGITGIPLSLSYSYPELTLSKPLREVSVNYGEESTHKLVVSESGEQQTVSNDYIYDDTQAALVAAWVRDVLKTRKTISGEFRADPRLDLYDVVNVEDRYGKLLPVAITNIKYTYNGSFKGSYTGRVLEVT